MEVKLRICYTLLVQLMIDPKFIKACGDIKFTRPAYEVVGMAGYAETVVTVVVRDIELFAEAYARIRSSSSDSPIAREIQRVIFTEL